MPKPPFWLQWLGPVCAGLAAGLGSRVIEGFWPLLLLAVAVGLVPILVHRLWRRAWIRRTTPPPDLQP